MNATIKGLGEIIQFKNGKKRPTAAGEVPVYGGNGILGYADSANYENCIIIGRVGAYCGSVYYEADKCWVSDNAIAAIPKKGTDIHFAYYLLSGLNLNKRHIGTSQPLLTQEILNRIECPVPEIDDQRRIAAIMRGIDLKIKTNQQINDNLYEMVNAYYKELFASQETELTTVGAYASKIYSGGTPTTSNAAYWDGAFGWLSSGETRNRFVIRTEKSITQEGVDNSSTKLAHKYDIVMASAGQGFTRGQTSMLLLDTYVNQSVIVIHADEMYLPFIFWNLANRYEELRAISDSSSIRGSLTTKMIASFEIPSADPAAIAAFSDFAWAIIPKIESNLLENAHLATLRDSLLPKLMSGEIDVSDIHL